MPAAPKPEDDPIDPGSCGDQNDEVQNREDSTASDGTPEDEDVEDAPEVDFKDVEIALDKVTDEVLVAKNIIPAERGYTIEKLQNGDAGAWEKASERFLKIANYKYKDIVYFYLPGVDEEDAKSAVGEIVPDLCQNISEYSSLPELEKAFRTALRRDIHSLQRKSLTKKRGEGKIDVTSELHGLNQKDEMAGQASYDDDDKASASSLEGKVNRDYGDWGVHITADPSAAANRLDQKNMMSETLKELELGERRIIELSILDQLKHKEIAKELNINVKQVGSQLNRAKAKLKKLVEKKMLNEKKN
jgi:RNA polymerase sigma factor (sigma-70 family)